MEANLSLELIKTIRKIVREEIELAFKKISNQGNKQLNCCNSKRIYQPTIRSKFGWLWDNKTLLRLYELLSAHGLIACKFQNFKLHFIDDKNTTDKINWLSSTNLLVYLFNQLALYHFIPQSKRPHKLIKEHFIDVRGNEPSNKCLRSSLNNVLNKKKIQIIENIIGSLKTLNNETSIIRK
jgi:hypothetical protein